MASGVLNVFLVLALFIALLFIGLSGMANLEMASTTGCAFAENGSGPYNCTMTDYAWAQTNHTVSIYSWLTIGGSYITYILAGLLLASMFVFVASILKRK
jgi:hypothetical protein